MEEKITVPELGESITEAMLASWLKKADEYVEEGEDLYELESDKATLAVPAPVSGKLAILVEEGADIEIGQVVGTIDTEASPPDESSAEKPSSEGSSSDGPSAGPASAPASTDGEARLSPAVRRIVAENNLDPSAIEGTGKGGRILKEDALKAAEEKTQAGTEDTSEEKSAVPEAPAVPDSPPEPAEPAAKPAAAAASAAERPAEPAAAPTGPAQRREKMSPLRQTIAHNLVQSRQAAAHLTTFNEINLQRVMDIRRSYKEQFLETHGVKLGFMSFFVKACCYALQRYPAANAFIEDNEIVYNNQQNIGIAVSTERGLIVPVLKNAGALSFDSIERQIGSFGERAKTKKITPDDLSGGTFTITNGGVFGSLLSTPIPTPPQSAILGMHAIQQRPVAEEGAVVIRPMMYVALTYDHRIMDGREAVGFLVTVKSLLEDPDKLLLGIV